MSLQPALVDGQGGPITGNGGGPMPLAKPAASWSHMAGKRHSWVLTCVRSSSAARTKSDTIPKSILMAWRKVFRSHLPSHRQQEVLREVLDRRSPEWIIAQLEQAPIGSDPLHEMLTADSGLSARSLATARHAESRWEQLKQQESVEGEQSLAELLEAVRLSR